MKINIKELTNSSLIMNLYDRYYIRDITPDNVVSSHWKRFAPKIEVYIDEHSNLTAFKGCGFGDLGHTNTINRLLKYLCNSSYFIRLPYRKDLFFLIKKAMPNLKIINSYLSYDCFRQICSLCTIRKYLNLKEGTDLDVLVIGDGYGFLSSLLKRVYPNSKITLIDIGKIVLFQAVNLQLIYPRYNHVLADAVDLNEKNFDFLYVPAEHIDKIKGIKYKLSINIASMQEMNYKTINKYFKFLRSNSTVDNLFYCCNRNRKLLSGGEVIEFSKYPWHAEDKYLVDEICPFYKYYFSASPPFIHKFDGLFTHRLTNLKIGV